MLYIVYFHTTVVNNNNKKQYLWLFLLYVVICGVIIYHSRVFYATSSIVCLFTWPRCCLLVLGFGDIIYISEQVSQIQQTIWTISVLNVDLTILHPSLWGQSLLLQKLMEIGFFQLLFFALVEQLFWVQPLSKTH